MEDKTCCCHKTKERTEEEVKKLLNRLSRIEGQIRGIRGMVEKKRLLYGHLGTVSGSLRRHERL